MKFLFDFNLNSTKFSKFKLFAFSIFTNFYKMLRLLVMLCLLLSNHETSGSVARVRVVYMHVSKRQRACAIDVYSIFFYCIS